SLAFSSSSLSPPYLHSFPTRRRHVLQPEFRPRPGRGARACEERSREAGSVRGVRTDAVGSVCSAGPSVWDVSRARVSAEQHDPDLTSGGGPPAGRRPESRFPPVRTAAGGSNSASNVMLGG